MDWATLQTSLPSWFEGISGLKTAWTHQPRTMRNTARAQMRITSIAPIGLDETRKKYNSGASAGSQIERTQVGMRRITLNCQVFSTKQNLATSARMYLERARTRLRGHGSRQTIEGLGLAIIGSEGLVDLDSIEQNRMQSRASMDIILAGRVEESLATDAGTWIQKAHLTSSLNNESGAVATALQINQEFPA